MSQSKRDNLPPRCQAHADADRLGLLWLLRKEFDEALLRELSWEYPGNSGCGANRNYELLREIMETGLAPCPLESDTGEICVLVRHGHASIIANSPLTPTKRRNSLMQLFVCWVLLNAYSKPARHKNGYSCDGDEIALFGLIKNSVVLGSDYIHEAARFASWSQSEGRSGHPEPEENLWYLGSTLILQCLSLDAKDQSAAIGTYETLSHEERKLSRQVTLQTESHSLSAWSVRDESDWPRYYSDFWFNMPYWLLDRLSQSKPIMDMPQLAEFKIRIGQLKQRQSVASCRHRLDG